jgi:hypothetical protein
MSRTETVTFNVGGEKFQVARSLLDFYPDSVLAKSISERWQQPDQDAKEEIFFDRCPQLFRQVLEYLRNKKVHLPITVSKKAVQSEFEHYCVDDVEEEAIDDSLTRSIQLVQSIKDTEAYLDDFDGEVSRLKNEIDLLNTEFDRLKIEREQREESMKAVEASKALFKRFRSDPTNLSRISWNNVTNKDKHLTESMQTKCNECLTRVGLKVERQDSNYSFSYVNLTELKPLAD